MPATRISRRAVLTAPLLAITLAGCAGTSAPTTYDKLSWDYLPRIRLNIASVTVDDSWTPRAGTREVGFLAPTPPVDALRRMAEDRLVAGGNSGRANLMVEDASIVQTRDAYAGSFAVRLDMTTSDGARSGFAEARVSRTRAIRDTSEAGTRSELYELVKQMMTDMNVEFEYQIRHSLRDYLQTTAPDGSGAGAPGAGAVDTEELSAPRGAPAASPARPPAAAPAAVPFATPEPAGPAP